MDLASGNQEAYKFSESFEQGKLISSIYYESSLWLIVRETINYWLILHLFPSRYDLKIALDQISLTKSFLAKF